MFPEFDDVLPRISSDQNCFQLVRCCKITILPLFYQWKQPTISQICHDFSNLSIRFLLGDIPGGPRGSQVARAPLQRPGLLPRADAGPGTGGRGTAVAVAAPAARGVPHYGGGAEGLEGLEGGFAENDGKMMGFVWFFMGRIMGILMNNPIPLKYEPSPFYGHNYVEIPRLKHAWFLKGDLP